MGINYFGQFYNTADKTYYRRNVSFTSLIMIISDDM